MATIKQMKMLAAKCSQAGMDYDFDSFKELENGEVNEKLAEIAKVEEKRKGSHEEMVREHNRNVEDKNKLGSDKVVKEFPVRQKELNGQRFGMVYKIVIDRCGHEWKNQNREAFIQNVVQEYGLATEAEEAVKASSSSSSDDPDYKAEMAQERFEEEAFSREYNPLLK